MAQAVQDDPAKKCGAATILYTNAWQTDGKNGDIPHAALEKEAVRRMLGNCSGQRILDLKGGSGIHARQALAAGAAHVDVVDASASFMEIGKKIEAAAGRKAIDWYVANTYSPLGGQVSELSIGGYDVVLAVWALDHTENLGQLETIWRNIATYLKPGGRVIGIRVANSQAETAKEGTYGVKYHSHAPISGGLRYAFTLQTNPPFTVPASSMETCYKGRADVPEKAGIVHLKQFDFQETDTVKANPKFWDPLLKDPYFAGFTAVKRP